MMAETASTAAEMPLMDAAFKLRVTWHQAMNVLLKGQIRGERRGGRWFVDEASVDEFIAKRDA